MPYYMYVALQADDKIAVLTIDPETGTLTGSVAKFDFWAKSKNWVSEIQ